MRDTKQTKLNLAFIYAVHVSIDTYLTAYITMHGPHLSPTFSLSQILIPTYFTHETYFPIDIPLSTFFDAIT